MAQHQRITMGRASDLIRRLDSDQTGALGDLIRLLVAIDLVLVKHEHTATARQLRKAFDTAEELL